MDYLDEISLFIAFISKDNKLFDLKELYYIINKIIDEEDLRDYIKSVKIISSQNFIDKYAFAHFSTRKKELYINLYYLIDSINQTKLKKNILGNNILILQTIFHEIEHIKQIKLIEENKGINTLEINRLTIELIKKIEVSSKILEKTSFKNIWSFIYINSFYSSYKGYTSFFSEKQAEYNSIITCQNILNKINVLDITYVYDFLEKGKNKTLLEGYKKILNDIKYPYYTFQKIEKYLNEEKDLDLSPDKLEDNSLENKMLYGFPITKEEYKKVYKKTKK